MRSATALALAPAPLVTTTPRAVAAPTSTASKPAPKRATWRSCGAASKSSAVYGSPPAMTAGQPLSAATASSRGALRSRGAWRTVCPA